MTNPTKKSARPPHTRKPHYNKEKRELWLGDILVKKFRQPAAAQEQILVAFEEQHWVPRIADPVHPRPSKVTAPDLHDIVRRLNNALLEPLIWFRCDGTGGVRWEACQPEPTHAPRKPRA